MRKTWKTIDRLSDWLNTGEENTDETVVASSSSTETIYYARNSEPSFKMRVSDWFELYFWIQKQLFYA